MKKRYWEIIVIAILSCLPFFWLRDGRIILGHDSGFRLDPAGQLVTLFYSWYPKFNFGIDLSLYKGFLVIQSPEAFFTFLTGSVSVGQQITCSLYFFLMGISMYVLMKICFPDSKYWILRMYAAIFSMYNFFILQGWFIAERAKFSVFAALPLYVAVLHLTFTKKLSTWKAVVCITLISFFLNGGGSPPLLIPVVASVFFAFVFYSLWYVRNHGLSGIRFCLTVGGLFALFSLLVNAYWIVPLADLSMRNFSSALVGQGGIEGVLSWERMISKNASLLNIMRLQGIPDWNESTSHPYAYGFLNNPILILLSFVPIIFVTLGLACRVFQKKWKEHPVLLYCFLLLTIGIILSSGTHRPLGIVYEKLMIYVPGFSIFRSSFYKFAPLVWFSMIILSGYAINTLIIARVRKKLTALCLGIFVCVGVFVYHYPYATKDFFRFENGFTTRLTIPSYVNEVLTYINVNTVPFYNTLVLPELNTGYYGRHIDTYTWGYFSIELLPREANRTFLANDEGSPEIVSSLYRSLYDKDKKTFLNIASLLGVRYILWRGDIAYNKDVDGLGDPQQSKAIIRFFDFPLVFSRGAWELYDVSEAPYQEIIRVFPAALLSHGSTITSLDSWVANADDPQNTAVLSKTSDGLFKTIQERSDGVIYEPTCVLCTDSEFEKTIDNLSLPKENIIRYRIRKILGYPEERQLTREQSASKSIDLRLSYMTKLVSDIVMYGDSQAKTQYVKQLNSIVIQLESLSGVEKNNYFVRTILFLSFHKKELESSVSQSEISQYLSGAIAQLSDSAQYTRYPGLYTYVTELPTAGEYRLFFDSNTPELEVDGRSWQNGTTLSLGSGYHVLSFSVMLPKAPPVLIIEGSDIHKALGSPSIVYEKINPVRYVVHVTDAVDPYILVLRQQFESGWKTDMSKNHMIVNGFANGWYVEKQGSYDIVIDYEPHRTFLAGLGITGLSLLLLTVFAILSGKRRQKSLE